MVKPTTDASSEVEVSEKTGQPILWNGQNWEYYKKLMELMVRKKNVVLYKIMKGDTVFDETWDDAKKNYGATSSSGGFAGGGGGARVQTHFTPASGFAESDDIRTEQQNDDRIGRTEETTDGTGAAASAVGRDGARDANDDSEGEDVDMPEVALTSPSSTREPWHSNPLPTFSDDIVLPPEQPRAAAPGNGGDAEPGKDRAGEPTTIHENDGKAAEEMTRWLYLYGGQPKLMEKNRR
ncbi:hypothetical protein PC119_g14962 [Phytophthora cactorum]|nr:hypothetical protein PC119_g14962 [Phytophthora cactorum]